jgi:5-histidylcysteine sulfoxide synthase/putative 4-mercaptohistidine N1-methyltranferase
MLMKTTQPLHGMNAFPVSPDWRHMGEPEVRSTLSAYFTDSFDRYESLFTCLASDAAFYEKPISLRHPLIFYFGHTATFFVNKLLLAKLLPERINPRFEAMFAVGVDEMSWDDLNEAHYDWPTVAEVQHYRDAVRAAVLKVIQEAPWMGAMAWDNPWWSIIMGVEHELIHLETSSVLIRQHRLSYVVAQPAWPSDTSTAKPLSETPANALVEVEAGSVRLGKGNPHHDPVSGHDDTHRYGWDNEYGHHVAEVPAFQVGRMLVSNAEYLGFVKAGGYQQDQFWSEEGLGWRRFAQAVAPTFWVQQAGTWRLRLMCEEVDMPWNWPVEVNCHEAEAFCRWKAADTGQPYRLPTEDEWYRLYDVSEVAVDTPSQRRLGGACSSTAVDHFSHGDFYDVVGNVWQWTCTPIYPFAGFEAHPLYDDFSIPTFDERHNLMKGGSWISCGNEALRASRYAFRRHFFQHAGFRYVVADAPIVPQVSRYEDDALLTQYAEFHFGARYFDVPNFPQAVAQMAVDAMGDRPLGRALDLGCAVGRTSFELARYGFASVTGVDFSARFINLADELTREGLVRYTLTDEGELQSFREVSLAELGLSERARRVSFVQGDACNLKDNHCDYDLVVAANLIDRLYDPMKFIETIGQRIVPGGLLVLTSPYTWLADHTPRAQWLGGFKRDGERYTTLDALRECLARDFVPVGEPRDVPFVIRETARKFQHTVAQLTCWERRR